MYMDVKNKIKLLIYIVDLEQALLWMNKEFYIYICIKIGIKNLESYFLSFEIIIGEKETMNIINNLNNLNDKKHLEIFIFSNANADKKIKKVKELQVQLI